MYTFNFPALYLDTSTNIMSLYVNYGAFENNVVTYRVMLSFKSQHHLHGATRNPTLVPVLDARCPCINSSEIVKAK